MKFSRRATRRMGFTLLEVLVALGIVAVVAVLSWRGLQDVVAGVQGVQRQDLALQSAVVVFTQLENDLTALHPPPKLPMAIALNNQGLVLEGVDHGHVLLPQAPQVKRIVWHWTPQGLERYAEPLQTPPVPAGQPVLLARVVGMQMRLLYTGLRWGPAQVFGQYQALSVPDLPLQGTAIDTSPTSAAPASMATPQVVAVEVALHMQGQHTWVRVLPLGAALVAAQKVQP